MHLLVMTFESLVYLLVMIFEEHVCVYRELLEQLLEQRDYVQREF